MPVCTSIYTVFVGDYIQVPNKHIYIYIYIMYVTVCVYMAVSVERMIKLHMTWPSDFRILRSLKSQCLA